MTDTAAPMKTDLPVATSAARFTVSVLDSNYVDIVTAVLRAADSSRVKVSGGDVSIHVGGAIRDVIEYIVDVLAAASRHGVHVSTTVMLAYVRPPGAPSRRLTPLPLAGLNADAHWTAPTDAHGATPAIQLARDLGTWSGEEPFVTCLRGDLATVLETVAGGVMLTSDPSTPSTTHVTISLDGSTSR